MSPFGAIMDDNFSENYGPDLKTIRVFVQACNQILSNGPLAEILASDSYSNNRKATTEKYDQFFCTCRPLSPRPFFLSAPPTLAGICRVHSRCSSFGTLYELQKGQQQRETPSANNMLILDEDSPTRPSFMGGFLKLSKKHVTPDSASSKKSKPPHNWSYSVNIVLVEAKDLLLAEPQHSISVGPPDTFVRFKLGVDKYKSKIVPKTYQPKWLEQFDMHMFDEQQNTLEIMVFDKRKDCCIGKCNVNLSLLEREKTHHEWYDLFECTNNNSIGSINVIVGKIFLLISISGQQSPVLSSPLSINSEDSGSVDDGKLNLDQRLLRRRYTWMNSHEDVQDIGILTVKAQGLAAADIGVSISTTGKSDPFCVLELVNARVQTHTEYKTLSPEWNKAFFFNIRDINAVLEVTVFDEDPNKKVEFLGKIAVPLLRRSLKMTSGEKKWFALKDRKLQRRAKGKIQMQFDLIWNSIRAAIRTVNPKERKYMYQEEKFKRQIFMRNAMRVKSIIMEVVDISSFVQSCWSWESPARSVISFIIFLLATYFFELYMVPIVLLIFFIRGYMYRSVVESLKTKNAGLEEYYADSDSDDDQTTVDDKEEKLGIKQRLIAVQDTLTMVQNALDYIASTIERVKK
uniref:C2 domain-containing protein n=1 Tax=Romanomermis culicivorax TaxID=13658 RepID=A0A915KEU7_ROMCU